MKHIKKTAAAIVLGALVAVLLAACGGSSSKNSLLGTWSPESVEINGSTYKVSELEAMGDYSISDLYIVIKEGGSAYVYENGSGAQVEWSEVSGGVKLGIQECKVVDGKIILENNDVKITLAKKSDSQEITTAESENTETADGASGTEPTSEKQTKDAAKDLDPKLTKILENIKERISEAETACKDGADQLLASVGDSYDAYKANKEAIGSYYDSTMKTANELYAYLETTGVEYFKAVADLKMDYSGWDDALDEFYDVWNDGMDGYYDVWDDKLEELYDKFDKVIESSSDSIGYSEYSDAWSEMYQAYSDSWSNMYKAYSDSWSVGYKQYSDVWSGFYDDNFDVDAILSGK